MLTYPYFAKPIGFAKLSPWHDEKGNVACYELGSVWVDPQFRGYRLAYFIINHLIDDLIKSSNGKILKKPIIAVVTDDNEASNKLFCSLEDWQRIPLTAEETNNFTFFLINGVNVLVDWGNPSSFYWYTRSEEF